MRIAIAGFQHETNTFAPGKAGVEEFRMADSWPRMLIGQEVTDETRGMNLPIAGAIGAAHDVDLVPILWCAAEPSGHVTDEAFDWISGMILDGLRGAGPLDGIYLDLHGAMVTESHEDGEAALLDQIRKRVGDIPIGVSLDLHANISPRLVEFASLITIYRTYPHLDMAQTGARCMSGLMRWIRGQVLQAAFRQVPFLIPLHAQFSGAAPCDNLYAGLHKINPGYADIAMGFTASDIHDCGPSIVAYAGTSDEAERTVDTLAAEVIAARADFDTTLFEPPEAVEIAVQSLTPTVLADVQDNPGAGGTSDTTGILHALIDAGAEDAIVGVICDPEFVLQAQAAGAGATFEGALGAKSGIAGPAPVHSRFLVETLDPGDVAYTGQMYGGGIATLGPSCVVRITEDGADIRIVVSSIRVQCLDRALFTHFGIDPTAARIVCVKSTVHHRADFEGLADRVLNVASPGSFPCRISRAQYRRLRPGVETI